MLLGLLSLLGAGCLHAPLHPSITPADRSVTWSGRRWQMRHSDRATGAGPSRWNASPAAVAHHDGQLCLALSIDAEGWRGAEVWAPVRRRRRVVVELAPYPHDDPAVVMGIFLYRDDTDELDVEWSRWGEPEAPPLQLVVPARDHPMRRRRLRVGPPHRIELQAHRRGPRFRVVGEGYDLRWHVPEPSTARGPWNLHINLWPLPGHTPAGPGQLCLRRIR